MQQRREGEDLFIHEPVVVVEVADHGGPLEMRTNTTLGELHRFLLVRHRLNTGVTACKTSGQRRPNDALINALAL